MDAIVAWLETQPIQVTTLFVAAISAGVALLWVPIQARGVKWALALASPFVIAWCVYWTPVWRGADSSEYSAWWGVFMMVWGIPSAMASVLVVYLGGKLSRPKVKHTT